jgi:hypothetical protein
LEHHDEYDSQTSQSKAFSYDEVREYRDRLYAAHEDIKLTSEHAANIEAVELSPLPRTSKYDDLRARFPKQLNFTLKPWRFPLWQEADRPELFAYKTHKCDGVCLIERVDLPDERIAIICIAIAGNPGNSVTNCVEELCFQVCERFEIPSERLVWIEHYDYDPSGEWNLAERF